MKTQINKDLHELDLELVELDGLLPNNEVRLADKNFLTQEEIKTFSKYAFTLQDGSFKDENTIDK